MTNNCVHQYPLGVQSVLQVLAENDVPYELRIFDKPARQASQAADLLGCPLGAIVKSLVFQKQASGEILMVLVSGKNRANLDKISELVAESVHPAQAKMVLEKTNYPVGAVPPVGIKGNIHTIIDLDLLHYDTIWASAGAYNILVGFSPADLQRLYPSLVEEIKQSGNDEAIV